MAHKSRLYGGILFISAATLMFELTLTRLFAVAEWYHFAFLSVSVALLGYASSGTALFYLPPAHRRRVALLFSMAFPLSILATFLVINTLPFDSYQLTWAPRQIVYLIVYYLSLIVPFGVSGFLIAYWLSLMPQQSSLLYAANLVGSAAGSVGLLVALPALGGEGTVMLAAGLAAFSALLLSGVEKGHSTRHRTPTCLAVVLMVAFSLLAVSPPLWAQLRISPYKSLSYALQASDARLGYQRWNVYSRIDIVESPRIHAAPGLSLNYQGRLPPQYGLYIDGDNLSPISRRVHPQDAGFLRYLPSSLPYTLRPGASALIIRPRGGMDVAVALEGGSRRVVAVEDNPLIVQVLRETYGSFVGHLYDDPRVLVRVGDGRSALQQSGDAFDIVQLSLAESYHPLTSGSYSLSENYIYTEEAFTYALRRLNADGLLVVTRWLQDPPSESLRAGAVMVSALERLGMKEPARHLIAWRSWSTMTLLASPSPFTSRDIELVVTECERLAYDLVHYPGMTPQEANRHNVLPQPLYYLAFQDLLEVQDRRAFYDGQFYDVSPPSDDHPFFAHYFRWRQIPQILSQFGKTWQPFGGSGFLLILALLAVACLSAALLITLPLAGSGSRLRGIPQRGRIAAYFAALGLGFLMVEMPLMQQFILYLGQPARSFIVVLAAILVSSGIGSTLSRRVGLRQTLAALIATIIVYPLLLGWLFDHTLALGLPARTIIAVVCLFPLGLLMGMPFAGGMAIVERRIPGLIPWLWAINGGASVVSSILATVVALSGGFRLVLLLAAACYGAAALAFWSLAEGGEEKI